MTNSQGKLKKLHFIQLHSFNMTKPTWFFFFNLLKEYKRNSLSLIQRFKVMGLRGNGKKSLNKRNEWKWNLRRWVVLLVALSHFNNLVTVRSSCIGKAWRNTIPTARIGWWKWYCFHGPTNCCFFYFKTQFSSLNPC